MVAAAGKGHDQVLEFLLDMSEVKADMPDTLQGQTGTCIIIDSFIIQQLWC